MRIVSRGSRGLAAALAGAGALAAASCGEVQGTPERGASQARQEQTSLECLSASAPERELVIQDPGVVSDAVRTTEGAWSFGRLVARMSATLAPEDFVRDWLAREAGSSVHGQDAATRERISQVLRDWPTRADGTLDLAKAPLRLRAIVNRMDLCDVSRGRAGEGHFVFDLLDASGQPLGLTVTLAYDLPARSEADVREQARRWQALASLTPGTEAYNAALQDITDRLTAGTGRATISATGPLRTADAKADPRGAAAPSASLTDDTQAPTAEITAPATGSFVRSTVAITANAVDDVGVARVDFFNGASLIGSSTTAPFTVLWNTTTATTAVNSLTAQAFDAAGNSGTSSAVSVTVDNNPPLIILGSPQYNPTTQNYVRGNVNVSWSVALQGGAPVALVQAFQDGAVLTSNPAGSGITYSLSWNTLVLGNRPYTLGFQATDAAGNVSAFTTRQLIVDNAKPSLSVITSPANGAVVSGVVTLAASASDSQSMAYVIFEVDGVNLTPYATTAPYTKTWDTTGKSGTHQIVAIATDRAGNTRRSNPVTVTVP
ncbi:Ig-like domain-containing protein [Corallococcus sp. BB11-1]|uniref:Ig-like domain-containing protein n=1 Tax=Corallococcus sp. BB11-1 TaxID=2996783 RepID=UPI0022722B52|nr:Ig-like domain-containing protein [Corallococcus sp. BB11-1]MCY1033451.1 Ig-like domain-containing protein [Corallococcus sp. BB11-1]